MRVIKQFFTASFLCLAIACTKPTLYREDNISVSKANIHLICHTLKSQFHNYSCVAYFDKTYKVQDSVETIKIQLQQERLHLIYKTTATENGSIYEQYEQLIDSLRIDQTSSTFSFL